MFFGKSKGNCEKNDKNETWIVNYGAVLQKTIGNKRKMILQGKKICRDGN